MITERFILAVKLTWFFSCEAYHQTMKLCQLRNVKFSFLKFFFCEFQYCDRLMFHLIYKLYWLCDHIYRKHQKISGYVLIMVFGGQLGLDLGILSIYTGISLVSCEYRWWSVAWCLSTSLDLMYIKPGCLLCISTCSVLYTVTCTTKWTNYQVLWCQF